MAVHDRDEGESIGECEYRGAGRGELEFLSGGFVSGAGKGNGLMIGKVLAIAVSGMLMALGADSADSAEFYVDPDFAGQGQNGSPDKPWSSIRGAKAWQAINAALGKGPVTVYFSARQTDIDQPQTIHEFVECRRSDTGTNRLTLDGMSKYNTNDWKPAWSDYSGPHVCRITEQKGQRALGWEMKSVSSPKQNYVTIRGFECTGPDVADAQAT